MSSRSQYSKIVGIFKMHGLTLRSEGAKRLCKIIEPLPTSDHDDVIEKVIVAVQKLPLNSILISEKDIDLAVKEVSDVDNEEPDVLLQIIAPEQIPKLEYSIERNKFVLAATTGKQKLHGTAQDKAALFRNRYTTVFQRIKQHKLFRAAPSGTPAHLSHHFKLTKVEFLVGGGCSEEGVVVLGLLTQIVEGQLHVEDDTGAVRVKLDNASFHSGLFPYNCLVLVEGHYDEPVLHADAIGLPPPEHPDTTRALLGNVNYFGGPGTTCAKYDTKLKAAQQKREAMFVILSDVWLDKIKVVSKLQSLLSGYSSYPPTAFILCGNFLSASHTAQQVLGLRDALTSLGETIAQFPALLTQSRFIFVPGPNDPGPSTIYPRPPLPSYLTEGLRKKVPCAEFVSNPCRLQYCTQEMVVFREDIMTKICRNCIHFPSDADDDDIPTHFGKTLVSQSHLCPLPLHVVPTYWGRDHCLALHPTPDFIVVADRADPFTTSSNGAIITNPGSFMKTDFSFKVYYPNSNLVEDSQIEDTEDV